MASRVKSILLLFLFFAGVLFVSAQPVRKYKGDKEKSAQQHIGFEEFHLAIPQLEELVQEDPGNAYYQFWLGKCLYLTYSKNQALSHLERAYQINPKLDPELPWYFGLTLHYNLLFDKAIEMYQIVMEKEDPQSELYQKASNRIAQCKYGKKLVYRREGELVKIENLGTMINSEFSEHSPIISANDSILLFTSRRPDCLGAIPKQNFYDEDIYIAKKEADGTWSPGRNIHTPVNSKGHDATVSLSADGSDLYLYRHKKAGGLYHTKWDKAGKKWKEPHSIAKPINSSFYEACVAQSADGNLMFFISNRPGGFGGKDIYLSRREGENWGEPQNLGAGINTPWDEDGPYFHPDGKTLYYSSNGPAGMGGYDIFVTEFDSVSGNWLVSLNMGYPVNTPDDDIYFVLSESGLMGYYASGKEGGYGEKDIYRLVMPYFPYPKRYFSLEVVGILQDEETKDTLSALVKIYDKITGRILDSMYTNSLTKEYKFELDGGMEYYLEGVSDGYPLRRDSIFAPKITDEDILFRKDLAVIRPREIIPIVKKEEEKIEIQNIYYDFDKTSLRKESIEELDIISSLLKQNPDLTMEIKGHTDWYGSYSYNVDLSHKRTKAVYDYLVSKGISPTRLKENWFSENDPIEENESDDGRQYNRRSEFRFYVFGEPVLRSLRLKKGSEGPWVDHTKPKGKPGFDNPEGASGLITSAKNDGQPISSDNEFIKGLNLNKNLGSGNENLSSPEGLTLRNIYFAFDEFNLDESSKRELDALAKILRNNPDYKLEILGHTDNFGSDTYNQKLSDSRCMASFNYLLNAGSSPAQFFSTGYSEHKPIDTNDSEMGRHYNRRVEFIIVKNEKVIAKSQK